MIRVVSGFKIGVGMNASIVMPERFLDEDSAKTSVVRYSELHQIEVRYYRISPCFLLEVQTARGEPLHFDLGNSVEVVK